MVGNRIKRCSKCRYEKFLSNFYRNKKSRDGYEYICRDCSRRRYYNSLKNKDNMYGNYKLINRHFLYAVDGNIDTLLKNKRYREDRQEMFNEHGNGWWWGHN